MKTTLWTITTILVATLVADAVAQGRPRKPIIGEPAPELWWSDTDTRADTDKEKGVSLFERFNDRIIVLFFFRTDDPASVEALPIVNEIHRKLGRKGVVILGITPEKKDKTESVIRGKEVEFPVSTEGGAHHIYEVTAFPQVYLIDTNAILTNRFHPLDGMEEKILTQIRKTPPPGADPATFQRWLGQARSAVSAKEYGKAYTLARDVRNLTEESDSLHDDASTLVDEIEEATKEWLEQARVAAREKDYDKACRTFAEVSIRFVETDLGSEADKEISRLMGDGKLKPKLNKAKDNARGELLNDEAAELILTRRFYEALKAFRVVTEEYPDTAAAKAADEAIDRINSDPAAQALIKKKRAEEEADRWLDIGDRFAKVKLYSKARDCYERVREEHPASPAAAQAERRLKDLPEDEPEEEPAEEAARDSADQKDSNGK